MPTFVSLVNFTEQGMRNIEGSPDRAANFVENAKKMGGRVRDVLWTSGDHDGVLIFEAPDETAAAALMISLGRGGNVKTKTLRAFEQTEMKQILGHLP